MRMYQLHYFYQVFEFQKSFLKKKASPALLKSQHFASLWAQRELVQTWLWALAPLNCTQSLVLVAPKERHLQTQLQLTWPSLWKQLSSHQ